MRKIKIYTDGGSRGNPGPAAIGFVFLDDNNEIVFRHGECIGVATNNIAEYQAVVSALTTAREKFSKVEIELNLDSQLVCCQLNGEYKVKDPNLKKLFLKTRDQVVLLDNKVLFKHVRREQNKEADKLVNEALDEANQSQHP